MAAPNHSLERENVLLDYGLRLVVVQNVVDGPNFRGSGALVVISGDGPQVISGTSGFNDQVYQYTSHSLYQGVNTVEGGVFPLYAPLI